MTTFFENDRRQFDRLYFQGRILLFTDDQTRLEAYTMNLSDGGVLIKHNSQFIPIIGQRVQIQAQDFPDAPIKTVIIRRIEQPNQIGVEFV